MKPERFSLISLCTLAAVFVGFYLVTNSRMFNKHNAGDAIDSFNGVIVYYNGSISNVSGRNLTKDNYNLGLKYQCVEFVKRYYFEYYNHKMPDSYGHAKDFFDDALSDGQYNPKRALTQYRNPSKAQPKEGDLLVFDSHLINRYGHVAIISEVNDFEIEIIQQNPGKLGKSRKRMPLSLQNGLWRIDNSRILGWLRKEDDGD